MFNFMAYMQVRPTHLSLLYFFVLQIALSSYARATQPTVHIAPRPVWLRAYKDNDQKIPLHDVNNGYFYQLSEEQIHVEKQADYRHNIREIVSEAGIQNGSEINVGFDPAYERLDFHQIIVWRNNKPQNRLTASAFRVIADETELSKFIYQGSYSAYCILSDIRKGDRIEYSYTITGRNPIFNNRFGKTIYFQWSQPIAHQYKAILAASGRSLQIKSFNNVPEIRITENNGLKCYEWESFQVKPAHDYEGQPEWYNEYARVQVSDYHNWQEVVDWAMRINPVVTSLKGELATQVGALKAKSGADKEKYFRSAVRLVQDEVRYMGIEMGAYSHRANTPEKVFNQRYGDCKDKSLLLASILTAGGIEAHMVLVNSALRERISDLMPSPNVFDHAVVMAVVNGKQVWVDPTIAYQRGTGTNIYFPNYGRGLVVKAGSNNLSVIPKTPSGQVLCRETYTVHDEKGKAELKVVTRYTMNEADDMRDRLAGSSMAETERNYLNYYAKTYPKIESKDSITVADDEINNELTVTENYLIKDFFEQDKETGRYQASFYANMISQQLPGIANNAKAPVAVNYPYSVDYTINIVLPYGWNVETERAGSKKDIYRFSSQSHTEGDTLSLNYALTFLKDHIPADRLDEYRQDIKHIKGNELSYSFTFNPSVSETPFRLNYWLLFSVVAFMAIIAYLGLRIYTTETDGIVFSKGAGFVPVGGWLIFIAIGLGLAPLLILMNILDDNYFNLNFWTLHAGTQHEIPFKVYYLFKVFGNVFIMCYASFCLVLLLNKRDILPKYITGFYALNLVIVVTAYVLGDSFLDEANKQQVATGITRAILAAFVWIPYFRRSSRVEETFIVPYPADNYRYEEEAVVKMEQ